MQTLLCRKGREGRCRTNPVEEQGKIMQETNGSNSQRPRARVYAFMIPESRPDSSARQEVQCWRAQEVDAAARTRPGLAGVSILGCGNSSFEGTFVPIPGRFFRGGKRFRQVHSAGSDCCSLWIRARRRKSQLPE